MEPHELGAFIDEHFHDPGHTLFRLETLPAYAVDADGDDYQRWLDGEPEPTWTRKQPWLDTIRRWRNNGQVYRRVRILSPHLTDYERYAAEFGYAYNTQAGEDIRVLRRGEHPIPDGLIERDFWVINDDTVVSMFYDEHGRFDGAEATPSGDVAAYVRTRDAAWDAGEPFGAWWARHPELHRKIAA